MKEFLYVFRRDFVTPQNQPTAEQLKNMMQPWQEWLDQLTSQNKLVSSGNRLGGEGKIVKPGKVVTNGPYAEVKEAIGGYIIVRASNLDEAAEIAKDCPILNIGGNVEIRPVIDMNDTKN
jgi:hypothetical protein